METILLANIASMSVSGNKRPRTSIKNQEPAKADEVKAGRHKLKPVLALCCALTAVLLYANTWNHGYVLDDVAVIEQNRFTQQGVQGIPAMFTTFYWEGYWSINAGLYRPLSLVSFALEHELIPNNPSVSHVVNILIYGLIAFLLFYFLSALLERKHILLSFIATMIFVLHPVHTEVVANIKSRDELLCFLFFISAAIYWLKWYKSRNAGVMIIAAGLYFLCLLSKEGGVVFLPVFPLMIYFFRDASPKKAFAGFWALVLPLVLFLAIHTWVIQTSPNPRAAYTYQDNALLAAPDFISRTATALSTTMHYFRLLLWPHPLSHDYSFDQVPVVGFGHPRVLAALVIIVTLIVLALRGLRSRTITAFAILYFAITFSLTSNLIIPIGATMAERFLFAPSLGIALLAGFLMDRYLAKSTGDSSSLGAFVRQGLRPLLVLAILATPMAALTIHRNAQWKDDLKLFTADLNTASRSARAHYNHASAYMNEVAFDIPDPTQKVVAFRKIMKRLQKALEIDPNYYDAWRNLGIACYYAAEYEQSITSLENATRLVQDNGIDFYWLGKSNFRLNRFENALEALKKSLDLGEKLEDTYNLMGTASFNLGRYDEAVDYYLKTLEDDPKQAEVMNNLAGAYGMMGNYPEAIAVLLKSYELDPRNANTSYFLAITYHKAGDLPNAELWAQKARELGVNI